MFRHSPHTFQHRIPAYFLVPPVQLNVPRYNLLIRRVLLQLPIEYNLVSYWIVAGAERSWQQWREPHRSVKDAANRAIMLDAARITKRTLFVIAAHTEKIVV